MKRPAATNGKLAHNSPLLAPAAILSLIKFIQPLHLITHINNSTRKQVNHISRSLSTAINAIIL